MVSDRAQRVLEYLQPRQREMTDLLERLVRAESPSVVSESQLGVQAVLRDALTSRGFRVRHLRGATSGGSLFARPAARPRQRPFQLILGHCDTVWPVGTVDEMPIDRADGKFRGPGAYDMKAGLVQGLFAVDALRVELEDSPAVTPVFLINSDEEIGSRESTRHIRLLAQGADRVLVLEPSIGEAGKLKTARKGIGRFTIHIHGKAAHAGLDPHEGASAILELSVVVQKLFAMNDPERGVTVNVGMIDGGVQPNVVAPKSTAVADVRVLTSEDARAIERAIQGLTATTPGTRLEVEGRIGRPPMEKTPGNRKLWELALLAADELSLPLEEATAGGGSDGNTTSQYAPTLDGLGAVGEGAHAAHEFLFLEKMVERSALLALMLSYPSVPRTRHPKPIGPKSGAGRKQ